MEVHSMRLSRLHLEVVDADFTRSGTQTHPPIGRSRLPLTSSSHPKQYRTSSSPIAPSQPPTWPAENPGKHLQLHTSLNYPTNIDCLLRFSQHVLIDTTPMPEHIPKVPEIGASSAPLMSASFFIGARCKAYNDDFMKCKTDANGRGEIECLKEGRKVTRCAASV